MNNNFTLKHKSATLALPLRYLCGKIIQSSGGEKTSREDTVSLQYPYSIRIVKALSRTAAVLIMLLTLGVGQMRGGVSGGYIYFDPSQSGWGSPSSVEYIISHDGYSCWYAMGNIANTKLYYISSASWGDAKYIAFTANYGWTSCEGNSYDSRKGYGPSGSKRTEKSTYGVNSGSTYLFYASSSSNDAAITTSSPAGYLSGGYSALNSTQTINTVVKTGSGSYTAANSKATISITSYEMTGNGAVTERTPSLATSAQTQTVSAARTATTTFTVGDVASGYQFDGWYTAATGGTQLSASTTYTYYPTAATTVYARFSEIMSTITLTASPSGKGTFTIGGAAATSTTAGVTTTRSVTAVPISGYHFVSWSVSGGASISSTTTNPTTITGGGAGTAATLTATFEADAVNSLTVSKGTGISTVTGSTSPVTLGSKYAISATVATGYTFSSWTATPAANGTFDNASSASTNVTVKNGSVVVTASATERMSTLTTSCHYDAGNPSYAAPSVSGSATNVGYVTTRTITATAAGTGYTFAGWTLTNCTRTDGGAATATSITVRSNGDGAAASVVANYEEVLTQDTWKICGGTNLTGDNWTEHAMVKKTGHSTESIVYYTFNISSTNSGISGSADAWSFKIKNGSTWYGLTADGSYWWTSSTAANQPLNTSGANIQLCANVVGNYEVKVDYTTPASPMVTVTFPTTHTVTYSVVPSGAALDIETSPSVSSGGLVVDGTNVTFTHSIPNTGFVWKGWYNNTEGSGVALGTENTYTQAITADATIYAVYTEHNYEVNVSAGANGTVSPSGTVLVKRITGTELTATPASHFVFKDWTFTGGGIALKSPSTATSNPATFTASSLEGTIQANFTPQWAVVGGNSDEADGDDAMGDWSSYVNGIANVVTVGGKDTGFVNITLPANSTFQYKVRDLSGAWYGNPGTMTYAANNGQRWNFSSGESNNCGITTAGAGTYKFAWNATDKYVRVTYPTSYTLSYAIGTVAGTDGSISTSPSLASGLYAASGDEITLTAPAPKAGFVWKGWYTNAAGTTGKINDVDRAVTVTMNANKTLYACYEETLYTVTLVAGDHGTVGAASVSAGPNSPQTITATPNSGFYFSRWTVTSGDPADVDIDNYLSATTTVTATGDVTLTASFISNWAIAGDDATYFANWSTTANGFGNFTTVDGKSCGYIDMNLPANTQFTFKVYNHEGSVWYGNNTSTQYMNYASNNNQYWQFETGGDKANCGITTAGAGTYRFTWNETDKKLKVTFPTSYTVTFGYGTGGSAVSATVEDAAAITSGQYAAAGKDITFTQTPATGYSLKGWYTTADGETTVTGMGVADNVLDDIAANAAVYAQYTENLTTVKISANAPAGGSVTVDGVAHSWNNTITVGVVTGHELTVTPAAGYYFAGWTLSDGADFAASGTGEANTTITVTGLGDGETEGQTLTANFIALSKIYFDNSYLTGDDAWDDVYVYFDVTWVDAGANSGAQTSANGAYKAHMTQIGTTGIYEALIPRSFSTSGHRNIAFATGNHGTNYKLYNEKGVYRTDWFYSADPADNGFLNIYRPSAAPNQTTNGTKYYSTGYWAHYDAVVGQGMKYYLHRTSGGALDFEFNASANGSFISADTLRIDHDDAIIYYVGNAAGQNYYPTADITTSNPTVTLSATYSEHTVTPTSQGIYTFILNQEGDSMILTVDYPAAVGDYRLVYTNTSMGSVIRTTDIIKNRNKEGNVTTMFINKDAAGAVLKLQKCTAISDRKPVWTDAGGSGASALLSAFAGKEANVYKFTIDIEDNAANNVATSATCSIDAIEVYNGPFYIKTDCANGGWASYTANEMEENTINFDGTDNTYNYYYCKWVDGITNEYKVNVKFVIATDYNNAVSDTISATPEEDFLVSNGSKKELLPEDANIRFSFNTKTCTAKRAYILGSTYLETFIWLAPNATANVYNYVKGGNGSTDMFSVADSERKFKDNGNWTYQMDVELKPNAKAGVKVRYPSWSATTTYLVPQTTELIGSSNVGQYDFRLVYDFKTNHMIAAWIAGEITENLTLDANVLMIREAQDASKTNVIILNNNTILNTDTAYGAIEFKRDAMVGQLNSMEKIYEQCLYYISFPFDVKVSDVIGIGKRGVDWDLYKYNGAKRAEVGWFLADGHETFWEKMGNDDVLHAYEGYCLGLEETHFNNGSHSVWTNISAGGSTFIYFPSSTTIGDIQSGTKTITVPTHICEIDRYYKQDQENYPDNPEKWRNHKITDSNWNVIGSPLFANGVMKSFVVNAEVDAERQLKYYYAWDYTTGNWAPLTNSANWMITETGTEMTNNAQTFNAMFGYFVQFAGTVTFEGAVQKDESSVVARRRIMPENYALSLELSRGDKVLNRAFVELRDNANDDFVLDEDMCLMPSSSNADIYTFAGAYDAMANVLSMSDHTVRVGVDIKKAGDYTFSMPAVFDGTAVLVDLLTGTRTNLELGDYTVSLNKGTINDRFVLEIGARKIVTSLDNTQLRDGKVHKFIENGVMYILRDGKRYDAQGKLVE